MFFRAVFDFSFTQWATPHVIKAMFVVGLILSAMGCAAFGAERFNDIRLAAERDGDFPSVPLALLVSTPIFWLLSAVLMRMAAEFTLVVFRISEQLDRRP